MELEFAFICDYADAGQKLHAMGIGFDTLFAPQLPITQPNLHLVAQFIPSPVESGTREFGIHLIDADGQDVVPSLKGSVDVPPPAEPGIPGRVRIAVAFSHIKFDAYGMYSFYITIQGDEKVRVPLRVAKPKARQDPGFTPTR